MRIALPYLLWGRSATSGIASILGLERFVCFLEAQAVTIFNVRQYNSQCHRKTLAVYWRHCMVRSCLMEEFTDYLTLSSNLPGIATSTLLP